jgi:hypothetical protein
MAYITHKLINIILNPYTVVDQRFAAPCKVQIAGVRSDGYGQRNITVPLEHHGTTEIIFHPFKVK